MSKQGKEVKANGVRVPLREWGEQLYLTRGVVHDLNDRYLWDNLLEPRGVNREYFCIWLECF